MQQLSLPLLFLSTILFITSCGSSGKKQDGNSSDSTTTVIENKHLKGADSIALEEGYDEAEYEESASEGFKTLHNQRYSFKIDIPIQWKAVDKSGNADGFHLRLGNDTATDLRVFGEQFEPSLAELYTADCDQLKTFEFADGFEGKNCISENEKTFFRTKDGIRLVVYIKGWNALDQTTRINLISSIKSLRFTQENAEEKAPA